MWEACVIFWQLLALQEDSAVGWITKKSPANFWQWKTYLFKASRPPLRLVQPPIQCVYRISGWARKQLLIFV